MAAPPLLWLCPTFVMSSSLQWRVALPSVLELSVTALVVCSTSLQLGLSAHAQLDRPGHVLCSGARIRFNAPSTEEPVFCRGPLSPFQVFGRWDLEALVAALSATLVMERNVPAIGGKR
ncbi:hypothetical protein Bca4012_019228 [Brassica carinata]